MVWLLSQHVLVCGLLAAVVALSCKSIKLTPATRHTLWLIVLVKVLLPVPVAWPWAVPSPESWFERQAVVVTSALRASGPTIEVPKMPVEEQGKLSLQTAAPAVERIVGRWRFPEISAANVGSAALALWGVASIALICFQLVRYARFLRRMRGQALAPSWLMDAAMRTSERLGVRMPEVRVVDGAPSPYVYGIARSRLIVPSALMDAVSRERWSCIFAHELAHLKRRDHWVRWLELIAGGVWFWNPVFWIARRNLRANAELACDAWVVWALPDQRRVYAETLIDVSELISKSTVPIAALGMGARGVRMDFERRLAMILHESNSQRITGKAIAIAALLGVLALPGWSQQQSGAPTAGQVPSINVPENGTPASAPVAQRDARATIDDALRSPVSIEFHDEHISMIISFLQDYLNTNIIVDQRAVKPRVRKYIAPKGTRWSMTSRVGRSYVSEGTVDALDLKSIKPSAILDEWTTRLNLTYKVLPSLVFISTAEQIEKDGPLLAPSEFPDIDGTKVARLLEKPIDWKNEQGHIASVADKLTEKIGVAIIVDARIVAPPIEPASGAYAEPFAYPPPPPEEPIVEDPEMDGQYATDGMIRSIKLNDVSLSDALKVLTGQLGLAFSPHSEFIWITTPARMEKDEFADAPVPANAEELGNALNNRVSMEFDNEHISKVIDFIGESMGVNFVLDQHAVPPPGEKDRQNMPYLKKVGDDYASTGYVCNVILRDMPLKDGLKILLVPLGLAYKLDGNVIFISTPELIASTLSAGDVAASTAPKEKEAASR